MPWIEVVGSGRSAGFSKYFFDNTINEKTPAPQPAREIAKMYVLEISVLSGFNKCFQTANMSAKFGKVCNVGKRL